jgi:hypothetical protein
VAAPSAFDPKVARRLAKAAVALNRKLGAPGDPANY